MLSLQMSGTSRPFVAAAMLTTCTFTRIHVIGDELDSNMIFFCTPCLKVSFRIRLCAYTIVCIYGSCAAGCNQEPVQAVVYRKLFHDIADLPKSYRNTGIPADPHVAVYDVTRAHTCQ